MKFYKTFKSCEIAGKGVLKRFKVAVCGLQCVDLVLLLDIITILGTHFYNLKLTEEHFYNKKLK